MKIQNSKKNLPKFTGIPETEFRFRRSPGFHRKTKWLTLAPASHPPTGHAGGRSPASRPARGRLAPCSARVRLLHPHAGAVLPAGDRATPHSAPPTLSRLRPSSAAQRSLVHGGSPAFPRPLPATGAAHPAAWRRSRQSQRACCDLACVSSASPALQLRTLPLGREASCSCSEYLHGPGGSSARQLVFASDSVLWGGVFLFFWPTCH